MSSRRIVEKRSLFAGVSFADLWRAARYRHEGRPQQGPGSLDVAFASRFAAPSQPMTAGAAERRPLQDDADWRLAA
jgi:hypothetical protein